MTVTFSNLLFSWHWDKISNTWLKLMSVMWGNLWELLLIPQHVHQHCHKMHISPDFISDIQGKQSNVSLGATGQTLGNHQIQKTKVKQTISKETWIHALKINLPTMQTSVYLCYIEQFEMLHLMKPVQINFTWLLYIKFILIKLPLWLLV